MTCNLMALLVSHLRILTIFASPGVVRSCGGSRQGGGGEVVGGVSPPLFYSHLLIEHARQA